MAKADEKQVAYCGLIYTDCGTYIATQKNDDKLRKEMAEDWSKKYNHAFKVEDINCVGCIPTSGKHVGQPSVCSIRKCGQEKGVINCAYCDDYACEKLQKYFEMAPVMKANLEEIRKGL
ncbi:DUF3795 domain-containing protein [Chloroflexota bacterium]